MTRPADLPAAERCAHGTRARYVNGHCRCDACRGANRAAYHERQRRGRELAAELSPEPIIIEREYPNGVRRRRACPGVLGETCQRERLLRRDSAAVCRDCMARLSFNGLVSAAAARRHLLVLARQGVGYKAVADAASLARSVTGRVRSGLLKRIRVSTARAILGVDAGARAGGSRIDAKETWRIVDDLIARGFTRIWIAKQLGQRGPGLQIGTRHVTAKTALAIKKLAARAPEPPVRIRRGPDPKPIVCSCARPIPIREFCARCEKELAPAARQLEVAA